MSHYDEGDLVRLSASFTTGSVAVDPTVVQLEVLDPDRLLSTYTYPSGVSKLLVGTYFFDLYAAKSGQYWHRWYSSGTVISAEEDDIIVHPSEIV